MKKTQTPENSITEEVNTPEVPTDPYGFLDEYAESLSVRDMSTPEGEREAWLGFLDMLCLTAVFQKEQRPFEIMDRLGALPQDEDLVRSLEPHERVSFPAMNRIRGIYEDLLISVTLDTSGRMPVASLIKKGGLTDLEFLAFLMALGAALNRKYMRIYSILQEDRENAVRPNAGLCVDLAGLYLSEAERDISGLLTSDSFLNSCLLENPRDKRESMGLNRSLILRPAALRAALGDRGSLGELRFCSDIVIPADDSDYVCFPQAVDELKSVLDSMMRDYRAGIVELSGEPGSGRRFIMSVLSADTGFSVLAVDLKKLLSLDGSRQQAIAGELILKYVFEDTILYIYGAEAGGEAFPALYVLSEIMSVVPVIFLGTRKPLSPRVAESLNGFLYRFTMPEADFSAQLALWKNLSRNDRVSFGDDVDLTEIVSKYSMNPGRIRESLTNSELVSGSTDNETVIYRAELEEQIRRICSVQFGDNAQRLKSPFTWADLKVDDKAERMLRRACDRISCRKTVNDDFGFGRKLPYGRGVSVVLYGPPGTGKTMAAQVLANELGLDIYRIDLSQISSKYIGETEKNLGAVFEAARNSNAILFFDEADSLFSRRTDVSSSHDKYANAETSYLLQKIEEYPGFSVLATNNMQNFDAAFKRRITYIIPIEEPSEATRLLLWQQAFPEGTPVSGEIDFRLLAQALELTGSNIKSIAVDAAYRAAAEQREITYADLVESADQECIKSGRMGVGNELQQAIIRGYRAD